MTRCPNCGAPVPEGNDRCFDCGAVVGVREREPWEEKDKVSRKPERAGKDGCSPLLHREQVQETQPKKKKRSVSPKPKLKRKARPAEKRAVNWGLMIPVLVLLASGVINLISTHTPEGTGINQTIGGNQSEVVYDTDENGNTVEQYYDSDGALYAEYITDEDGSMIQSTYYYDDDGYTRYFYEDGVLQSCVDCDPDGSWIEWYYDENYNPTSNFYYDADGTLESSHEYEYNENDQQVVVRTYDETGTLLTVDETIWDEDANWQGEIRQTVAPDGFVYRIRYYDSDSTQIGEVNYDPDTHELLDAWGKTLDGTPCGE